MSYPPIEDHGVIGNMRSLALVCKDATINFYCFPHFDSGSVFAALLDDQRGGSFSIKPEPNGVHSRQMYLPETNVLVTHFMSDAGMAEITDYMPVYHDGPRSALVRRVQCVRGEMHFRMRCDPRFDYGRATTAAHLEDGGHLVTFTLNQGGGPLRLRSTVPMLLERAADADPDSRGEHGAANAVFTLKPGESAAFVMECVNERPSEGDLQHFVDESFDQTLAFWRHWSDQSTYRGRWREIVQRSALVLKLLTSADHGAIIGAGTFGLPEQIGGARNWDYRFCWLRDAAFTVHSLMQLGYTQEADQFIHWAISRTNEQAQGAAPQVLYAVDGSHSPPETTLAHFAGWRDSRPVRIGNGAAGQMQLDVVGELTDAIYLADKNGTPLDIDVWRHFTDIIDWVCDHWSQPEQGIWEVRGPERHFLSGRLMCWVALDRALRMAGKTARPAPIDRWRDVRDAIANSVLDDFWSEEKQAFVQYPGSEQLDASVLLMPMVKFIHSRDKRWLSTLDAVGRELAHGALVSRYVTSHEKGSNIDGLDGTEGAFTPCSFWYVECLARAGRVDEARLLFEQMLGYANHLGLYSEEIGANGEHLGNTPQALTHLALIGAASALDTAIDARQGLMPVRE